MKHLIAIVLALASLSAHAAEDKNWGVIAKVDGGMVIHGRYNSFEYVDNVGFLVVRFTSNTNKINFYIAAVSTKACDMGFGQVGFFDTAYQPLKKEDYVKSGGNGIAAIGDLICYLINKKRGETL